MGVNIRGQMLRRSILKYGHNIIIAFSENRKHIGVL